MANRRMFSLDVVNTDLFLDLPASTQALYFQFGMRADDDGFISSPKRITNMVGCNADDLKLLIAKGFVIQFDSGVVMITHWKINNYLRSDRYRPTLYQTEKESLTCNENGYSLSTVGIPVVDKMETQNSIEIVVSKDKESKENTFCAESEEPPHAHPVISLMLNNKTLHYVFESDIDNWKELYPAVDIMQELRKMKGWLDSNPTKRKTSRGINRFINSWLAKAQDNGGSRTNQSGGIYNGQTEQMLENHYNMVSEWARKKREEEGDHDS